MHSKVTSISSTYDGLNYGEKESNTGLGVLKMILKKETGLRLLLIIAVIAWNSTVCASDWVSPIDIKYQKKNPVLYEQFDSARKLIDSYRGERRKLILADEVLRNVLDSDPAFAPAYREYGRIIQSAGHINYSNYKEGTLEKSEQVILKSIEIEPQYADAYVLLGHIYTEMKKYTDAKLALETAQQIGTESPWLDINWADLLKRQNRDDEAFMRYTKVVGSKTSNKKAYSTALSGITSFYRKRGNYPTAKQAFLKELEYEPESAWKWVNYSEFLLFYYGDIDGAVESAEKSLQLMDFGAGRYILACALFTKWATLYDDPNQTQTQDYFDRAWSLYPHPEKIIRKTKRHKKTKITAIKLNQWLQNQAPAKN